MAERYKTAGVAPETAITTSYQYLTDAGTYGVGDSVSVVDSVEGLRTYYFYLFDNGGDNVAALAGQPVGFKSASSFNGGTVTSDLSDSKVNLIAGINLSVVTDAYYCWIQTWGQYETVLTDTGDDLASGDTAVWSADSQVDRVAAGTYSSRTVGICISDDIDGDDTVELYLNIQQGT